MTYTVPERCEFHIGDIFDGKYKVERKLGEGTFGIVYKVSDNSDNVFAAKLLKLWTVETSVCKNLKDRFKMEFETGQIKSEHLARSYSYGEIKGNPYILMEFCSGGDLKDYADRHRDRLLEAGCDVLCGLRDLHAHGKVHRDLKPENVLCRSPLAAENADLCKITDFGTSRVAENVFALTMTKGQGTPLYMAPEMLGGHRHYTKAVDVYSYGVLGSVVWDDGQQPYAEQRFRSPLDLQSAVLAGCRPQLPADCPIAPLIRQCWSPNPADRPPFDAICGALR